MASGGDPDFGAGDRYRDGAVASRSALAPRRRIITRLLTGTALANAALTWSLPVTGIAAISALSASLISSTAAYADGGAGGFGMDTSPFGSFGGTGGSGITGNPGGNAVNCAGGGGGAAGGGAGGTGGSCVSGGTGGSSGAAGAPNGGTGGNGIAGGGGGGGGGANGISAATIFNISPLAGGNGGNGGQGFNPAGVGAGGGGGGAGGYGAIVTGAGSSGNTNSITGGRGGDGGVGGGSPPNQGGAGGSGGVGILFTTSGDRFTNFGSVTGGNGGNPGNGPLSGNDAAGGAGIVGAGLNITNGGTIAGGLSSHGATQANGITFTGGNNTLSFTNATTGITGNIDVTGQVTFSQTVGSVTVNNAITGSGNVIIDSTAQTVTFSTANFYSGTTTVTAGTLALTGTGSIASSSAVNLATGATFDISQQTSGASVATLGNTAAGQTGTVSLGNQTLTIFGGASTFGGVIQDSGILANTGGALTIAGGTQTLSGANTYTGATTVSGGTLALTGTGSIAQSSLVTVGAGSAATFDISGTTSGASIMGLAGDSNGIVTLGSQTLTITNGLSTNVFYGAIGGSGGLTITGGFTELGGTNGYTGVTTINSGAHLVLLGTATIASSSKVIDNGALDLSVMSVNSSITSLAGTNSKANLFLGSHSLTLTAANDSFAGIISGSGGLALTSGTETLIGTNTYTGATKVNGGTLTVNGSIATSSLTTVNTGGTLTSTGTVGNTTIAGGGMFAPGNATPGSSMTVSGNLAFQSGAQYLVALNPTTSSFAAVTGTATLGGATVNATYAAGSYVAKQYTILSAGGVSGTFGSVVNTNLPANFHTTLSYDAKDAYLNLTLGFTGPNYGGGLNGNQQSVGNALINFFNATGGIPLVFGTLTPAGLTQVSGESATGSQQTTFNAMNMFFGTMLDPSNRGPASTPGGGSSGYASEGDASAYASDGRRRTSAERDAYAMFTKAPPAVFEQRWSVWAAGFGGSQTTDGNAATGSNTATSSVYGTAVGADYSISPFTVAGFALAGGGTNFNVAGSGSGHSDLFQAGAFIRHTVGPAYISAALGYGWQDITTNRTVTAAGTSQLRAQFDANAFSGRLEGGYRFVTPWMGVTPYAAAQFTTFDLPAYAEQALVGSNAFALAYGAKDVTDTRSELGIRTDKSFAMTDGILTLRGRLAWAHDYDPNRSIASTFQTLPGASFVVNGAAQAADSALVTASLEKKWLSGWSAAATFEGEFSDVTRSYAGKGVVRYAW
jgi:uncharacterized protein with beta-barrel porin domain